MKGGRKAQLGKIVEVENPPFEDVFPIQDGDFPLLCLFTGGYLVFVAKGSSFCLFLPPNEEGGKLVVFFSRQGFHKSPILWLVLHQRIFCGGVWPP